MCSRTAYTRMPSDALAQNPGRTQLVPSLCQQQLVTMAEMHAAYRACGLASLGSNSMHPAATIVPLQGTCPSSLYQLTQLQALLGRSRRGPTLERSAPAFSPVTCLLTMMPYTLAIANSPGDTCCPPHGGLTHAADALSALAPLLLPWACTLPPSCSFQAGACLEVQLEIHKGKKKAV